MHVPILFSAPLQGCYQVDALCAGHYRVVHSECLLAVSTELGILQRLSPIILITMGGVGVYS